MAVECSSSLTRRVALGAAGAALALLGGCVVVPAEPYEIGAPVVVFSQTPESTCTWSRSSRASSCSPSSRWMAFIYWRPSVSLGIWGGWGGGSHWHGRGDRHWRGNPGRGGSHWQGNPGRGGNHWQGNPGRGGGNWGRGGGFRGGREGGVRRP